MVSPALFATILTMDAAGPVDAALLVREVRIGAVGAAADLALLRPEDPRTLVAGRQSGPGDNRRGEVVPTDDEHTSREADRPLPGVAVSAVGNLPGARGSKQMAQVPVARGGGALRRGVDRA
jgi:hypothetical protein